MSFKYVLFSYPRTESVKYGQDFDFNTILEMIEETNTKYSDVAAEVCLLCENIIWYLKIKLKSVLYLRELSNSSNGMVT